MRNRIALPLALSLLFSLAACGASPVSGAASPAENASGSAADGIAAAYLAKAEGVVVTEDAVLVADDGSGAEQTLRKNPGKVAVLYASLNCLWYEAGGEAALTIGGADAVALYKEQIGRDVTQDEGVKVAASSALASKWDVESILAERPDLIIASVGMKGYDTISGPAAAVGIPVIGIDYDGVADYLKWFKVFCNLNGRPELWDEVARQTVQGIADVVSAVPREPEPPRAAILLLSTDTLKAYGNGNVPGMALRDLGGVNVFDPDPDSKSNLVEISLEDLYAFDPDVILFQERGEGAELADLFAFFGDNPVWNELTAVRAGKVFPLSKGLFYNKANRRFKEAYEQMFSYLYPAG